jgi:hypothetical protein
MQLSTGRGYVSGRSRVIHFGPEGKREERERERESEREGEGEIVMCDTFARDILHRS